MKCRHIHAHIYILTHLYKNTEKYILILINNKVQTLFSQNYARCPNNIRFKLIKKNRVMLKHLWSSHAQQDSNMNGIVHTIGNLTWIAPCDLMA